MLLPYPIRPAAAALAALACLAPALPAQAGNFMVAPVRVELSAQRSGGALTITNNADEAVSIEARGMQWTQQDGRDAYADTRELILAPPAFTLAPGASQVLRVALRRAPDPGRELAYRVFLTEMPPAAGSSPGDGRVAVALRLSLPVFVKPAAPAQPRLQWSGQRTAAGELQLQARNDGNQHVQLGDVSLKQGERLVARHTVAAYLLPGQARSWTVKPAPGSAFSAALLSLDAGSDAGPLQAEVPVQ